jgi:ETC complex I subunit-like protein
MSVRIYRPSKTAMQSGRAKTKLWVLEPTLDTARVPEPLMGWVSSGDTNNQVRLTFETKEEAIAYAKKHELDYIVQGDHKRSLKPKAYADNFAADRFATWGTWTH